MKKPYIVAILVVCLVSWGALGEIDDNQSEPDKPAAPVTDKAAAVAGEQPDTLKGPTKVTFFVFVVDIDDIDGAAQNFTVNVYVRLRWKDERLASEFQGVRKIPLEQVWNPRVLIINQQKMVRRSMPQVVEIEPGGEVTYHQRYVGPLSQPLRLSEFPFDEHRFAIHFAAIGYTPERLEFVPELVKNGEPLIGGGIADRLSLPDWAVTEYKVEARPYTPVPGHSGPAGFVFEFIAKRHGLYYIWQVILPLVLIVMMSWAAFWIDPTNAGAQIGVATSSMLTLIAYRFLLGHLLPRLPYMTRLDYFTLGGTILVFLTLVEVILTSLLARHDRAGVARAFDRCCRILFPVSFIVLLTWSLIPRR